MARLRSVLSGLHGLWPSIEPGNRKDEEPAGADVLAVTIMGIGVSDQHLVTGDKDGRVAAEPPLDERSEAFVAGGLRVGELRPVEFQILPAGAREQFGR